MKKTNRIIFSCIIIILILFILTRAGNMRKDIPFQEIVPLDGKIAVINAGNWFKDTMQVSVKSENGNISTQKYNESGLCLFEGLENDKDYTVTINRTDFKGRILYKKTRKTVIPSKPGKDYIILVGASVGKEWGFDRLNERMAVDSGVVLGSRTIYEFDKRPEIDAIINLPVPVKAVIIKECAAYFPRDIQDSKENIKSWIDTLRARGIIPVVATTVPVTKAHDEKNPGKFDGIMEYNDFIRRYAYRENLAVLDLEKALRISDVERHLNTDFAQEDGLHVGPEGYKSLDAIGVELIKEIEKK